MGWNLVVKFRSVMARAESLSRNPTAVRHLDDGARYGQKAKRGGWWRSTYFRGISLFSAC